MNKKFSEDFLHDIAELLDMCRENNGNTATIIFDFDDINMELDIDMTFSVKEKDNETNE